MKVGTQEHYDILKSFDKQFSHMRLDREEKSMWPRGHVYQSGETNNAYTAFIRGYSAGRASYLNQ